MDTTSVVKETHHSCSSNLVAKSVESPPTKIDSISVDLINVNDDIDTRKCEHFSIRGYASEMRKKDWKKSWPFALDVGPNRFKELNRKLPPLLVPKFRWWCCQNCLQEIGAEGITKEERTVVNNSSKPKAVVSCPHVSSRGDALTYSSDLQQAGKINVDSKKCDAIACANVDSSARHPLFSDKSEKKADNADTSVIGQPDILEHNISMEIPNYAGIEVISRLMRQTLSFDEKVASLQLHHPDLKDNEVSNVKRTVEDATETRQTGKSACDERMELVKGCGSNGIESTVHRVPDAIRTRTNEHPSLEFDDRNYASSESDEVLPGTASGKLHRRKNRKVRLLTELLDKTDEKNNPTSTEDSPSSSIPDASIGKDSVSAFEGQVNFQGNVTSSLPRRKKRKKRKDEEWMPRESMSSPNNGHKNPRTINRGAETADGIASSDSEGTVNRSNSQTPAKGNLVNFKVDKSSIPGKKKSKKIQNSDECPSLRPARQNLQKERQKKPGDTTKSSVTDIVMYKSNDVSTGCGMDSFPESAKKSEKKSILLKKKSKMHQDHDWKASPIPCNDSFLREGPSSWKDVEIRQFGNVAVPLEVTQNADKGLQFSLNTCLPAKRYDAKYSTPIREGPHSLSAWQGRVLSENDIGRKDLNKNYVGESSFPTKSKIDACMWKGTRFDLNSNQTTYGIPFLNEKQKHRSPPEVGSFSSIQQMDFSGTSNSLKTVEFLERATAAREHYDQRVEMASEQGAVDDIMEIAELMAKNQYERCLPDTEIGKQLPDTTSNTKIHQMVDLNKVYGNEEMNLFQETDDKLKTQAKNGRFGKFLRADIVVSGKQKSVDDFSHIDRNQCNMSQLEQSYPPAGFRPFPLCGEKPLNGVQFSATNSIRQNSAQNFQWIGNVVGQKSSHATAAALGVCNTCQSAPQQNREATHLWPSMIPNSMMPYVHSIPHKYEGQVAKLDVLSHCPSSLPKGTMSGNDDRNFLNLSSNFEKNSRKFDSETLRRTHAGHPNSCKHNGTGPLDLYSNDTIPAMHLLSLMDAGLQSGAPVDVDGNQRFIKKTSILPDHHSKEFPRIASGGYRTNSMKPPSFDCYGKSHLPENFCECMSATPSFGPSTSSFQNDRSFKKPLDFIGQLSHKSRGKEKKKYPDPQRQNKNNRSKKTESSNSGLNTTCCSFPAHSMAKLALGTSDFTVFPKQRAMESAKKQKLKTHPTSGTFVHPKSSSENGICRINRNPADFTVPEAGNKYMIGGEDLKFGREAPSSGLGTLVGHKRQRKLTVRKERSRNQIS